MIFRTVAILACAVTIVAVLPVQTQPAGRAEALASRLQQHYDKIGDFEADFVQTILNPVLRTKTTGNGHLYVKRPGRMKWVYATPERQELIYDGKRLVAYYPDDKVANITEISRDSSSPSLLFLAGQGNILRDFIPSNGDSTVTGTVGLKLTPRRPEPEYEYFVLMVEEKSAQLRGLRTRDNQGGDTTTTFQNLRENGGVRDSLFEFTPPKGVEVFSPGAAR